MNNLVFSKIFCDSFSIGLHGLLAGFPSGRADLSVLVGELEGLHQTEGLIDSTADRKIVDSDLEHDQTQIF